MDASKELQTQVVVIRKEVVLLNRESEQASYENKLIKTKAQEMSTKCQEVEKELDTLRSRKEKADLESNSLHNKIRMINKSIEDSTVEVERMKQETIKHAAESEGIRAEMEQITIFQRETQRLKDELIMHEKNMEIEHEQDLLLIRNHEKLRNELDYKMKMSLKSQKELCESLDIAKSGRDESKKKAAKVVLENEVLHSAISALEGSRSSRGNILKNILPFSGKSCLKK